MAENLSKCKKEEKNQSQLRRKKQQNHYFNVAIYIYQSMKREKQEDEHRKVGHKQKTEVHLASLKAYGNYRG